MKEKIIYYEDELNDEFSGFSRKPFIVDKTYKYHRGYLWRGCSWFLYTILMKPIAYFYMKFRFHFKIVNKKGLRKFKKSGYFLYANHTNIPADGFMPSLICFPRRVYVLVNSFNFSLWGTRNFMAMIGAIPIPTAISGMKEFKQKISDVILNKEIIMIYPEAHVWPYYTGVRPFSPVSFAYPVSLNKPIFTFTVTYHKGKHRTHIQAFVDGPFYPNETLSKKEAMIQLRDSAYQAMKKRSCNSTYEKIIYRKKEN